MSGRSEIEMKEKALRWLYQATWPDLGEAGSEWTLVGVRG